MDESTVILVTNDGLGQAEEALRHKLVTNYFQTLLETELLPGAILFYAQGVKLTVDGSPCLAQLRELETEGVRLIICRTCLDFYGLLEKVRVGVIGNMLMIVEQQKDADKVITV